MKDVLIAVVLGLVMLLNGIDILIDVVLGVPGWHIAEETLVVLASGVGFVYLLWERRIRAAELRSLSAALSKADEASGNIPPDMYQARHQYSETIAKQFQSWGLTISEQQVAMLLLKGLSFKEIASVRDTREKTVRQQASTIYSKSGLEGRHAFSAWFLEDFLDAPPGNGGAG